jgi:hypothetical protein
MLKVKSAPFFMLNGVDKIFYFVPIKLYCLEHLLFAAYLILFAWLVTKIKFFKNSGLTNSQLIILFLLKVMAGIFYGWIGIYYGQMAQMIDTWAYHQVSLQEYHLLITHPLRFLTNVQNTYEDGYTNFLTSHNSWWNDIKAIFLIKILAVFNVLSFGHYYVNVIFFSFLTLFGPVAIYRVMLDIFPGKKIPVLMATFLIPSFLYWTSGLHKEGLIFTGLALMIYQLYFGFKEKRFPLWRALLVLLGFMLVLILRNFLVMTLIPPLMAWFLALRVRLKPIYTFLIVSGVFIALFFVSRFFHPNLDFPAAVVLKQNEFLQLGGGSAVTVNQLEPSFGSFVRNAPQALSLSAIRPFPSDVRHLLSLAAAIEINFLLLLFLVFLFWRKNGTKLTPLLLFCIFFSLAVLMMIGYTVNVLGAIVRYRSIVLPLLMIPVAAQIDWEKIGRLVFNNIKDNNNVSKLS